MKKVSGVVGLMLLFYVSLTLMEIMIMLNGLVYNIGIIISYIGEQLR